MQRILNTFTKACTFVSSHFLTSTAILFRKLKSMCSIAKFSLPKHGLSHLGRSNMPHGDKARSCRLRARIVRVGRAQVGRGRPPHPAFVCHPPCGQSLMVRSHAQAQEEETNYLITCPGAFLLPSNNPSFSSILLGYITLPYMGRMSPIILWQCVQH